MATSVLHLSKCKKSCLCLRLGTHKMNENRLNLVKEITFLANSELKDTEERIWTWKCWQLNNIKGNVIYKKRAHDYNTFSLLSYSQCCWNNVAVCYKCDCDLVKNTQWNCQWCHRKRPLVKAPRGFIASMVVF